MAEVPSSNSVGVIHPTRPPSIVSAPPTPPSTAATSAWVGGSRIGSKTPSRRSYEQIILDSSSNILIRITIQKIINSDNPDEKPRSLSTPQVGELIFDYLEIDPADCLELDLSTGGRYDTKELLVKAGAKLGKALTAEPLEFRQHKVNIAVVTKVATKVTFKNVPISVPDEEILHLCSQYGDVKDDRVRREVIHFGGAKKLKIMSSTRWVEMTMKPGKAFRNFYWLAGPQPGDVARRITVLHSGQPKQCSWCLKYPNPSSSPSSTADYCSKGGNGKLCEDSNIPRSKLSEYSATLKGEGYISLKDEYLESQAALRAAFPPLPVPNAEIDEPKEVNAVFSEDENVDGVKQVGYEDSEKVVDAEQVNNNVGLATTTTSPIPASSSPPPIITSPLTIPSPTTIISTRRPLSVSTSTPSLKQRSQPFLHPAVGSAKTSPQNQRKNDLRKVEKPLLDFVREGTDVDDAAVKAFVQWSVDNGNVVSVKGKPGERVPKLKALKEAQANDGVILARKKELEVRIMEQLQVVSKSSSLGKGDKARSFSESGLDDSGDQDSILKTQRVHSPLKL